MDGNPDNDIASAGLAAAIRRDQRQRLRDQAEFLLQALERIDMPKDHTGIEKAAKALSAVNKVMNEICTADTDGEDEMAEDSENQGGGYDDPDRPANDDLAAWRAALERKLLRFAAGRTAQLGTDVQSEAGADGLRRDGVPPARQPAASAPRSDGG